MKALRRIPPAIAKPRFATSGLLSSTSRAVHYGRSSRFPLVVSAGLFGGAMILASSIRNDTVYCTTIINVCVEDPDSHFDELTKYKITRLIDNEAKAILFALFLQDTEGFKGEVVKAYLNSFFDEGHRERIIESLVSSELASLNRKGELVLAEEVKVFFKDAGHYFLGSYELLSSIAGRVDLKLMTEKDKREMLSIVYLLECAYKAGGIQHRYYSSISENIVNEAQLFKFATVVDMLVRYELENAIGDTRSSKLKLSFTLDLIDKKLQRREVFAGLSLSEIAIKINADPALARDKELTTMMHLVQRLDKLREDFGVEPERPATPPESMVLRIHGGTQGGFTR